MDIDEVIVNYLARMVLYTVTFAFGGAMLGMTLAGLLIVWAVRRNDNGR